MLVIKKNPVITSSTYNLIAIGATAFLVTFGVFAFARFQTNNYQVAQAAAETQGNQASEDQASMRKVAYANQSAASSTLLPDTSASGKTEHSAKSGDSVTAMGATTSADSTGTKSTTDEETPTPTHTSTPTQSTSTEQAAPSSTETNQPEQNPSLLGGVVGGVLGVVGGLL